MHIKEAKSLFVLVLCRLEWVIKPGPATPKMFQVHIKNCQKVSSILANKNTLTVFIVKLWDIRICNIRMIQVHENNFLTHTGG